MPCALRRRRVVDLLTIKDNSQMPDVSRKSVLFTFSLQ